jgi:hypothetical protein
MLHKFYFIVFERYIPELKKYDSISFLHQPMTSGQPLKIVQRHMAHPVDSASILLFRDLSVVFLLFRLKTMHDVFFHRTCKL